MRRMLHRAVDQLADSRQCRNGKPAGVPCNKLDNGMYCTIFGQPERPSCCAGLQPSEEMCRQNREEALIWLRQLESLTV